MVGFKVVKVQRRLLMYKIYNEYDELIRTVKRKEEADYFVDAYGWTKKFFKEEPKQLVEVEDAPF